MSLDNYNMARKDGTLGAGVSPLPLREVGGIACAQVNLHHCFTANDACNQWLGKDHGKQKIAFCQEPYMLNNEAVTVSTAYRNVKKTDWTMYREEVQRKREELLSDKGKIIFGC